MTIDRGAYAGGASLPRRALNNHRMSYVFTNVGCPLFPSLISCFGMTEMTELFLSFSSCVFRT